jgi:aryl-alcohol dehydrogenase-like predicted oxidoreductase
VPGRATLASNQVEYSLLNRAVEAETIPAAQALGLGILPWSPLGRGVLTGKYRSGTPADSRAASPHFSTFVGRYLDAVSQRVVEAVARAADGLGWSPLEVALAWVRDRPGVTAPVIGARTAAQLRESLTVEECELPAEITAALDDVSADQQEVPE